MIYYFTAHTINCICLIFRVHGIYDFGYWKKWYLGLFDEGDLTIMLKCNGYKIPQYLITKVKVHRGPIQGKK